MKKFGRKKERASVRLPKTAQQSIPIRRIHRDGIWEVDGKFSRCWRFTDINYAVSDEEDKKDTLIKYCALEKGLPTDAITKISIVNKHLNPLEFQKEMLMPSKQDGRDDYRREYNRNLIEVNNASDVNELVAAIKKPFGLGKKLEDSFEDDEFEFEEEDTAEIIEESMKRFNTMVDDFDSVLSAHLSKISDLTSASTKLEYFGSGECAAEPSEILTHVFGQKEHNQIVSILSIEDRDQAVKELRALSPLEKFTDEALNAIVEFWHDCSENIPEHCDIEQTLRPDGKIDLTISCIF